MDWNKDHTKKVMTINDPKIYGYILWAFVTFSYIGCIPFFMLAGKHYRAEKLRQKNREIEIAAEHIRDSNIEES
jgi:hypothetical protein